MADAPAQNLRDILLDIRERRGKLTPEIVLDEARDENHPLHHRFEWDDSAAAEKFRLSQAANLLRVKYKQETVNGTRDLRAFVVTRPAPDADEADPRSEYTPIEEAVLDPITRQLLLNQMRRDWMTFKSRYGNMAEFAEFIAAQAAPGETA
jgi:hypothetical protein